MWKLTRSPLSFISTSMKCNQRILFSQRYQTSDSGFHNPDETEVALRDRILASALLHVPEKGWTDACLQAGSHSLGMPPHVATAMFPRGAIQLVCYFYQINNDKMTEQIAIWKEAQKTGIWDLKLDMEPFNGIPPQIKDNYDILFSAIRYRLSLLKPVLKTWNQAMGLMAIPTNADLTLPLLQELLNEIMYQSGDTSVDMSWYTKRIGLGMAYGSTELFMLQDQSLKHEATWRFLERRIQDLKTFNSGYGSLSMFTSALGQVASVGPGLIRNVLGFR